MDLLSLSQLRKRLKSSYEEGKSEGVGGISYGGSGGSDAAEGVGGISYGGDVLFKFTQERTAFQFRYEEANGRRMFVNPCTSEDEAGIHALEVNGCYLIQNLAQEEVSDKIRENAMGLGICRPTEKSQKCIVEFLLTAGEFFKKHPYHGKLLQDGAVVIRERDSYRLGDSYDKDFTVIIVPTGEAMSDDPDVIKALQEQDLRDIGSFIFGFLLPSDKSLQEDYQSAYAYQEDMKHFSRVFDPSHHDDGLQCAGQKLENLHLFSDHTALWSPKRRVTFLNSLINFNRISEIDGGPMNIERYTRIESAFNKHMNIPPYNDWRSKIKDDVMVAILRRIKQKGNRGGHSMEKAPEQKKMQYENTPSEFQRYSCMFTKHSLDWLDKDSEKFKHNKVDEPRTVRLYIRDPNSKFLSDDEYGELLLSVNFPTYIMDIVNALKLGGLGDLQIES